MSPSKSQATPPHQSLSEQLHALARNLWWTWNNEVQEIFRDIDPDLWSTTRHNPMAFLRRAPAEGVEHRARSMGLEGRIRAMSRRLHQYMEDRETWAHHHAGALRARPVVYFSAEFGLHEALPLYSGGLGVLSGDHLKSASDLGIPAFAVGILYAQGFFIQHLDENGWQVEEFGRTDLEDLPLALCRDESGEPVEIAIPSDGTEIRAQVWRAPVGRVTLLLLDTDIEGNDPAFREVTHRLYWGDQESRLRQELVLGVGGMRALRRLGVRPGVLHLNEGHSAFALLEAARMEMEDNGVDREEALHRVGRHSVFTTHTPVPAGHDRFPPELLLRHLHWLAHELGMSEKELLSFGRVDGENDEESFCMTVLPLKVAYGLNGVAAMHGDVSRQMWKDLWPALYPARVPIGHVSNGVNVTSWMAPEWRRFIERHVGLQWQHGMPDEEFANRLRQTEDPEIWEIHEVLKARMISFVRNRAKAQERRRGASETVAARFADTLLDPRHLTIGFARRFATYKRATLMLRDRERLRSLVMNEDRPVQFVFAGKAHPKDEAGKRLIQEIAQLQKDPAWKGRIAFVENYDIEVGRMLVQGVDVWLNNPRRWEEASGTSGMKVVLNGGLNCSIADGWWYEAYDGRNGFLVDSPGPHASNAIQDERDAEALYRVLEEEVVPCFYNRDDNGLPTEWIRRQRWAFRSLARRYGSDRMVMEYARDYYLPAAIATTADRR